MLGLHHERRLRVVRHVGFEGPHHELAVLGSRVGGAVASPLRQWHATGHPEAQSQHLAEPVVWDLRRGGGHCLNDHIRVCAR